ncbi:T9SS type B sorting domain-containing protein [Galbibacter pacificus]|uniref:T9SS type B sorting domain-containing protein n=1 Tax=Galbibacter pacificus TaxID=2996052 RepID=A0ABT6FVH6_9FLAO|nr:T9SS type B sorting domain-containing protein [Galbibacter pacificus]MDG3583818.1 T9SS type B sorting domain-containing protein [Galbibacter pacificus]MDG3587264.1 T9SS type B sorting domain-containing protein [Galbibacter pacificus]
MKIIAPCFLVVFFIGNFQIFSQSISPDCIDAVPICKDILNSGVLNGAGTDDFNGATQSGCLLQGQNDGIESNAVWFRFRATATGQLGFNILPNEAGQDLDFAVYGPNPVCGSLGNPVGNDGTLVDCGISNIAIDFINDNDYTGVGINPATGTQTVTYAPFMQVQEGEEYLLLVNSYFGESNGFQLEFTGNVFSGSNQALDCSLVPNLLQEPEEVLCEGETYILDGTFENASTYRWSVDSTPDNGTDDFTVIAGATGPTYEAASNGIYRVEAIYPQGFSEYDEVELEFLPVNTPVVTNIDLVEFSNNNTIDISVEDASEYQFQLNDGNFQESGYFKNVPVGLNTVTINHISGCGTAEIPVMVSGYPKFFTPNGDGIHDTWNVVGLEGNTTGRVFIFDRYGKLLKQLATVAIGWDGTYNGKMMPSSDYWFRLEFTNADNELKIYKSNFTLKR